MEITEELGNGNLRILVPIKICNIRNRRLIVLPRTETETLAASPLLIGIANALHWQRMLDEGKYASIEELALAVGKDRAQVSRTLRLALLSPEIVHQALTGGLPITAKVLLSAGIPADREEQKKVVGIE